MTMLLDLALVALIAVLAALLVFRDRVALVVSASAGVVFVILALVALSTAFAPGIYERAATYGLEQLGVLDQVRRLDDQLVLNDVADASGALRQRLQGALGQPAPAPTTAPRPATRLIEQNLYPGLVSIVSAFLRIGALLLSLAAMVALVALEYACGLYADRRKMRAAVDALDGRVADLETQRALLPPAEKAEGAALAEGPAPL